MQLKAKLPWGVDVGVVDLDFVGLSMGACAKQPCNPADGDISDKPRASATRIDPARNKGGTYSTSSAGRT
jgi:hypothetical protein